jgi:hypothetical protein
MEVIIYTNENGNVSLCIPSGELSIEDVLVKDCPQNAVIVDDSILPKGTDDLFFNAWEFDGISVTVNLTKAKEYKLSSYNADALKVAQARQLNTLTGVTNPISDADFLAMLVADRAAIASAANTAELVAISNPDHMFEI